jgi:chitinase
MPREKIVLGLALYGRGFRLQFQGNGAGQTTQGASTAGNFTNEAGFLSYFEVNLNLIL